MSRKLLLVGWDSADWKVINPLLDRGEMPVMDELVTSGVMGNLRTLEPMLSPMLWTSIATGKRAYDHGVHGLTDVDPLSNQVRPVTAASRSCKAVWNILSECDLNSYVIGWFATHGERIANGGVTSNLFSTPQLGVDENSPVHRGTIWPEEDAAELGELRVGPHEIEADVVSAFVPRWLEVDQLADDRLMHLRMILAECFSVQAASTWVMENKEWDFLAVYFRAIDEISHHFMPFHPPKMDGVPRRQFEIYKDVVNGAYRLHDMMLARLIHLAGPDTTVMVVSDHGFHSDHLRPRFTPQIPAGITVWHRPHGIFAASGPGFLEDELVHGASLLDITPTALTLFDLPVGEDMEGKVLLNALRDPSEIKTIPSWEATPMQAGGASDSMLLSQTESQLLLEQFEALGYIEPSSTGGDEGVASTIRENNWTLARACMDGSRFEQALPQVHRVKRPFETRVFREIECSNQRVFASPSDCRSKCPVATR